MPPEDFLNELEQIKGFKDLGRMAVTIYSGIVEDPTIVLFSDHSYRILTSIMIGMFSAKPPTEDEDEDK